jgi:hypothetical protein
MDMEDIGIGNGIMDKGMDLGNGHECATSKSRSFYTDRSYYLLRYDLNQLSMIPSLSSIP